MNPLVYKDLLTYTRGQLNTGGTARLVAYVIFFALPLLAFAWALAFVPGPHRFAMRHVFMGICGLLAFFHLGVAVPASTAFALERDRDTLESLIVSPLGPWRLVLGKLGSALAVGSLAKAAVLPPLAVAFALGGGDLGFLLSYLLLLVAVDISLASFALYNGCRHRDAPTQLGWVKNQTTQTQMALQATVGISVLSFLLPFYAIGFLIPLSLQHGVRTAEILSILAPLGALHPLAALAAWGPADVFGFEVPVWLLGVAFHLSLAAPLLAGTVDSQRSEGSEPSRATRLTCLPAIGLVLLLTGAVLSRCPDTVRVAVGLGLSAFLLITVAVRVGFQEESGRPVTVHGLLGSLHPLKALESAPGRSPGFVVLVALLCAPLLLWVGNFGRAAASTWLALTLAALAITTLGARLSARVREQDDEAFVRALRGEELAESDEEDDEEEQERRRRAAPRRTFGTLVLLGFLLPTIAAVVWALGRAGALPALSVLEPLVGPLACLGLAMNPFSGVLPVLADPRVLGSDAVLRALESVGVAPWVAFLGHIGVYGAALAGSLATLRPPLDLAEALREERDGLAAAGS